jgi:hypothetical protein
MVGSTMLQASSVWLAPLQQVESDVTLCPTTVSSTWLPAIQYTIIYRSAAIPPERASSRQYSKTIMSLFLLVSLFFALSFSFISSSPIVPWSGALCYVATAAYHNSSTLAPAACKNLVSFTNIADVVSLNENYADSPYLCAISSLSLLECWSSNITAFPIPAMNQLNRNYPAGPILVKQVSVTMNTICVLTKLTSQVLCFGSNSRAYGLADNSVNGYSLFPDSVLYNPNLITQQASVITSSCYIRASDSLAFCRDAEMGNSSFPLFKAFRFNSSIDIVSQLNLPGVTNFAVRSIAQSRRGVCVILASNGYPVCEGFYLSDNSGVSPAPSASFYKSYSAAIQSNSVSLVSLSNYHAIAISSINQQVVIWYSWIISTARAAILYLLTHLLLILLNV